MIHSEVGHEQLGEGNTRLPQVGQVLVEPKNLLTEPEHSLHPVSNETNAAADLCGRQLQAKPVGHPNKVTRHG